MTTENKDEKKFETFISIAPTVKDKHLEDECLEDKHLEEKKIQEERYNQHQKEVRAKQWRASIKVAIFFLLAYSAIGGMQYGVWNAYVKNDFR
jgi:hypothetical protein